MDLFTILFFISLYLIITQSNSSCFRGCLTCFACCFIVFIMLSTSFIFGFSGENKAHGKRFHFEYRTHDYAPRERSRREDLRILGLEEGATYQMIRSAYRTLAKKYHPDKNPDCQIDQNQACAEQFLIIQNAYNKLTQGRIRKKRF